MVGDDGLADLVSAGEERAFAALYSRHHQAIYRYCRSIVAHDGDAQDALQSTFAAALVALRRARPDAPLRPWLFRIAHNESISLLRRRRATVELSDAHGQTSPSAEEASGERERFALLVSDLGELGERQRGALVMRELSGLSHVEIASALEMSVNGARQTIFDARQSLAEFAEGRAMACEAIRHAISDGDGRALRSRRVRSHLRACPGCAEFSAAIPERSSQLQALAPPLAPALALGVLGRLVGGSSHGGGAVGVAAGAAGKSAGAVLAGKVLVGVAVVATGTAGVAGLVRGSGHATHSKSRPLTTPGPRASGAGASGAGAHAGAARSGAVVLRKGAHALTVPGLAALERDARAAHTAGGHGASSRAAHAPGSAHAHAHTKPSHPSHRQHPAQHVRRPAPVVPTPSSRTGTGRTGSSSSSGAAEPSLTTSTQPEPRRRQSAEAGVNSTRSATSTKTVVESE